MSETSTALKPEWYTSKLMTTNVSEPYFPFSQSVKNDNPSPCFVLLSRFTKGKNNKECCPFYSCQSPSMRQ